jgi:hypothetical protein
MSFRPTRISLCKGVDLNDPDSIMKAMNGWTTEEIESESDLRRIITTWPYGTIVFEDESKREMVMDKETGRMKKENQRTIKHAKSVILDYFIYDIDNDDKSDRIIQIDEMIDIMEEKGVQYAIITSKSHGIKGNFDRYRLFVFLDWSFRGEEQNNEFFIHPDYCPGETPSERRYRAELNRETIRISMEQVAEELGIDGSLDRAALKNFAGKYYPSPKTAIYRSNMNLRPFDMLRVKDRVLKVMTETIMNKKQKRRRSELAKEANKEVGTWKWFMEHSDYRLLVNPRVLYGLDLRDIVSYYEHKYPEGIVREYEQGSYSYVDIKSQHKYSFLISGTGEHIYHDFNTAETGNVVSYLKNKLPDAVKGPMDAAFLLKKDFPEEVKKMEEPILLDNPAYYVKKIAEISQEEGGSIKEVMNRAAALLKVKKIFLDVENSKLLVTQSNDYVLKMDLPANVSSSLYDHIRNNSHKKKPEIGQALETEVPAPSL